MAGSIMEAELKTLFPDEESKQRPAEEDVLGRLVATFASAFSPSSTSSTALQDRRLLAQLLGDLARVEENRAFLGERVVEQLVSALLTTDDVQLHKWAARALGNLSYDNPTTIEKAVAAGVVPRLVALIKTAEEEDLQRNSTGALANLASHEDDVKAEIVKAGAIPLMVDLLRNSRNGLVLAMACRVITNLADAEQYKTEIGEGDVLSLLSHVLESSEDDNAKSEAISALTSLTENTGNAGKFISGGGVRLLISLIESEEEDEAAAELLITLSGPEETKVQFKKAEAIPHILKMVHSSSPLARKTAIKCLAQLVLNEEIMVGLFEHAPMVVDFLRSEDLDTQLNGAMIIGNLARNEAGCLAPLVKLLSIKDGRLQQVVGGALRNLAIPASNKPKLVEAGALAGLVGLLQSTNAHAIFAAIGAIKCLLTDPANRQKFVDAGGLTPLINIKDAIIIDASQNDEDRDKKPKDMRVQYEAARTLAILTEDAVTCATIVQEKGLGLLIYLLESNFEILQFEAVKAIRRVADLGTATSREALVADGVLDPLVALISHAKSDAVKLDTLVVISQIADDPTCRSALRERGVLDAVQLTAQASNSELATLSQRLLSTKFA